MSTEGRDLIVDLVKTGKMSPLVANPLLMAQISTLQELGTYAPWQLLRLPNVSKKALNAIEQVMLEHGLRLASDKVPGG
jgi:DNA-directed RNA polymerase alpha subunit